MDIEKLVKDLRDVHDSLSIRGELDDAAEHLSNIIRELELTKEYKALDQDGKNVAFVNIKEAEKQIPEIVVPTRAELASIKPGVGVKLYHNSEKFWVTVKAVNRKAIVGIVANDLVLNHPFKFGDTVIFTYDQVWKVEHKKKGVKNAKRKKH